MKIPKKLHEVIDVSEIDINNFTKSDVTYRLNSIFSATHLNLCSGKGAILREACGNKDLPLHMDGYPAIEDDIFYLKLFKEGLVEIEFFEACFDSNTVEGEAFDDFMSEYLLDYDAEKNVYTSYGSNGSSRYDIKRIIDENYEKFIDHIFANMLPGDKQVNEDNFDYVSCDRMVMDVTIPAGTGFVDGLCEVLPTVTPKVELVDKLNSDFKDNAESNYNMDGMSLKYPLNFFLSNPKLLNFFKFLEKKGQIKILSIDNMLEITGKRWEVMIEIKYQPRVYELNKGIIKLFLKENNTEVTVDDIEHILKLSETDKGYRLYYGDEDISFNRGSQRYEVIDIMFDDEYSNGILFGDLYQKLYSEDYSDRENKKEAGSIRSTVSGINRDFKGISGNQKLLVFKEKALVREKII